MVSLVFLNDKIILWNIRVEFPHEAFRPAMCISAVDTSQLSCLHCTLTWVLLNVAEPWNPGTKIKY